ncbi:HAD-IA family hydrolase [Kribbella sp. NBC_00709]|uniref:HAD-IA family hydrolase n=1 Tax=Kribbella sp. NBC_00709 TaxID=2975972 RepID=UPI002E2AA415|nr:HAD-IA family hydrolase [Kribbella sp. NBC_00709]
MWSPNARDVGGLPTRYGVPTRARALLRSECIDAAGLAEFETVGAGLVLDLRSDWELKQPHPLEDSPAYQRISWIDPVAEATRDSAAEPELVDVYRNSLTRNAAHIGRIFTAIAEAPAERPVVVHCKSGKDRTGLTVAVLLDLVGVPRSQIAADYAISETNLGLLEAPEFSRSRPETILASLEFIDERFGGVRGYLGSLGLSVAQIHQLATRLVPTDAQAIVFDFDGLLMDTETTMVESWQTEWAYHGLELSLDGFWPGHGGDISEERYAVLAAAVGTGFDRDESHARRLAHRERLHKELDFRPGIRGWISSARELGLRVAIASSSPRNWVVGHLKRVDAVDLFDEVVTGDEVTAHKPDPAIYQLALQRLGVPGLSAIAVEDTPHGVAAAQAAGMFAVAVPNPFVTPAAVAAADLVLSSADDVLLTDLLLSAGSKGSTGRN